MEGLGKGVFFWLMIMAGMLACAVSRSPVLHKVGGKYGWTQNINYTEWSIHEQFYVGDWLYFVFDKRYYNVLEVNETNYEQCNDQNFIMNITRGGRDVFNLTEAKPFYFLSSGGYCYGGMKVAVNVEEFIPSPAPAPAKNSSPTKNGYQIMVPIMVLIALSSAFLLKLY
ncbi:hypothetical protein F0562_004378 [Nyssa sinensis]|uniref:Phytocyanin domain-containing protein n=1 Tax=Nyssa sinensis TaxID=561372 RepID=A0A5J5BYF4_9ASTE|nr:hypothetical protein F0562_004378 [Nyssa sinensis]